MGLHGPVLFLPSEPERDLAPGSSVNLTWKEIHGFEVGLELMGPLRPANLSYGSVCFWEASSGSCAFVAVGGNHTLYLGPVSTPEVDVDFTIDYQPGWT
jgi:hypothetical protein